MASKLRQYLSVSGGALLVGALIAVGAIAVVFGGEHALSFPNLPVRRTEKVLPLWRVRDRPWLQGLPRSPGFRQLPSGPLDTYL